MASRVRDHNWAASPLGPHEAWPRNLRSAVELMLACPQPAYVGWGPDLLSFYNDSYRTIAGAHHPTAFAHPYREMWLHIWDRLGPLTEKVMAGEAQQFTDQQLPASEGSSPRWFSFTWTPLRCDDGSVGGFFCMACETTERVLAEAQRSRTEARLAGDLAGMRRLFELRSRLSADTNLDSALCEILAAAVDLAGTDRGTIQLLQPGGRLEVVAQHGFAPDSAFIARYRVEGLRQGCDLALKEKRRTIIEDISVAPGLAGTEDEAVMAAEGIKALHATPMITRGGETVGVLTTQHGRPVTPSNDDLRLIDLLAWTAAEFVERQRTDAALRASEERLRQFGEASANVLWIINARERRLEYLSPAFETVWGRQPDAILADLDEWYTSLHPDDRESVDSGMDDVLAGHRMTMEYRIVRPDGGIRYIQDTGFPIFGEDGQVHRVAGIAQDWTERRQAELGLEESEGRLRHLIEGIPQLLWRAAEPGEWTWASPQWERFTGQSSAQSRGWGWLECVHPDDRGRARDAWAAAAAQGEPFAAEYRIRYAADGRYCWFTTRATPVPGEDGRVREWLGTSTDVDELRRLQGHQQLLLAELQHRVRNTLGIIRSIVRRSAQSSRTVDELCDHLHGRIGAFARVQAMVTRQPDLGVSLRALLEDEFLVHAARQGEHLRLEGPEVLLRPKAAESLSLAVHELTTNAVKYGALSNEQGCIRVRWRVVTRDDLPWLELSWAETGLDQRLEPAVHEGFGTELLRRSLPYELQAETRLELRPEGLHFFLSMPLPPNP